MNLLRQRIAAERRRAFTLVELIVSMVVLTLLLVLFEQLTSDTQKTMSTTMGRLEQFRGARQAFEGITRRLGQATLNTYWDYSYSGNNSVPTGYMRQSELRFISGSTLALGIAPSDHPLNRPTHAIFFQAPLGLVANAADYHGLNHLLNTWGYCIEYGDDSQLRPGFLAGLDRPPPLRYRFRLVELQEPSESFSLYLKEAALNTGPNASGGNAAYTQKDWFSTALGDIPKSSDAKPPTRPVHVLAENVVALIILPKLTKADQKTASGDALYDDSSLSPFYLYDSTSTSNNGKTSPNYSPPTPDTPAARVDLNPKNQLPPVVQVTMVAVDEASYARFQTRLPDPAAAPDFKFPTAAESQNYRVKDANGNDRGDLKKLQDTLQSNRLNYRVFTTDVSLKAAKWSRDQTQ